jgi:hypothetical protein
MFVWRKILQYLRCSKREQAPAVIYPLSIDQLRVFSVGHARWSE